MSDNRTESYRQCLRDIRGLMAHYLIPNTLGYNLMIALLDEIESVYLHKRAVAAVHQHAAAAEDAKTFAPGNASGKRKKL
ncbi:uncharacterized protein H6S33_007648 [Morchella sextelata]|uniref:uncharacterized protein n=1 Tax=Morchella sextelata TaxID=1174677 RepID=UPI001D05ADD7|nr:uncharacterized protein H6S33_007648 [Morchella sextelata]KAH0603326.1 hypothetical protein H6S33_007648 [Morchella sextelata]